MKTRFCIGLILLFGLVLITGCDRRSLEVPTDPTQVSSLEADWVLTFEFDDNQNNNDCYYIKLYDTSEQVKDTDNTSVVVVLDSVEIPLQYFDVPIYGNFWYADQSYQINNAVQAELKIDGTSILRTTVTPVNKVSVAFPASYDFHLPLDLNWAVATGNQYQFVKLDAWFSNINGENAPYSSYVKQVAPYARNHVIPANSISLIGEPEDTELFITVREVNYKIANKTAVMVYQDETQGYSATGEELQIQLQSQKPRFNINGM